MREDRPIEQHEIDAYFRRIREHDSELGRAHVKNMNLRGELADAKVLWFVIGLFAMLLFCAAIGLID
jgi:hypothetical protein